MGGGTAGIGELGGNNGGSGGAAGGGKEGGNGGADGGFGLAASLIWRTAYVSTVLAS